MVIEFMKTFFSQFYNKKNILYKGMASSHEYEWAC